MVQKVVAVTVFLQGDELTSFRWLCEVKASSLFHRNWNSINYMLFAKKKRNKKMLWNIVFYGKGKLSQHVVLHFTEVFNRMNNPEDFT